MTLNFFWDAMTMLQTRLSVLWDECGHNRERMADILGNFIATNYDGTLVEWEQVAVGRIWGLLIDRQTLVNDDINRFDWQLENAFEQIEGDEPDDSPRQPVFAIRAAVGNEIGEHDAVVAIQVGWPTHNRR